MKFLELLLTSYILTTENEECPGPGDCKNLHCVPWRNCSACLAIGPSFGSFTQLLKTSIGSTFTLGCLSYRGAGRGSWHEILGFPHYCFNIGGYRNSSPLRKSVCKYDPGCCATISGILEGYFGVRGPRSKVACGIAKAMFQHSCPSTDGVGNAPKGILEGWTIRSNYSKDGKPPSIPSAAALPPKSSGASTTAPTITGAA